MNEESQIERIELYLSGNMADADKFLFQKELASDPQLSQLFREHKFFLDGIAGMKTEEFIKKVRGTESIRSDPSEKRTFIRTISIAASIFVLGGLLYFLLDPFGARNLAKKYYEPPLAQIQRSHPAPEDSVYESGMRAFTRKDWKTAISSFNRIQQDHKFYRRSLYYLAHSYIGDRSYAEAYDILNEPLFKDGQYAQQAEWFKTLMMIYLKYPDAEVIKHLQAIESDPGHFYREKAFMLLKKLE